MAQQNDQQIPQQQQKPLKPRKPRAAHQYKYNHHSSNNVNHRHNNSNNTPSHKRPIPPLSKPANRNKSTVSPKAPRPHIPEPNDNIDIDNDVRLQLRLNDVIHGVFITKSVIYHKNVSIPKGTVGRVQYSQESRGAVCVVFATPFDGIEMSIDPDIYLDFGMIIHSVSIATVRYS